MNTYVYILNLRPRPTFCCCADSRGFCAGADDVRCRGRRKRRVRHQRHCQQRRRGVCWRRGRNCLEHAARKKKNRLLGQRVLLPGWEDSWVGAPAPHEAEKDRASTKARASSLGRLVKIVATFNKCGPFWGQNKLLGNREGNVCACVCLQY